MRYVYYPISQFKEISFEVLKKQEPDMVSYKILNQYSEVQVLVKE